VPEERRPEFPGRIGGNPHDRYFKEKAKLSDPKGTALRIAGYLGGRKRAIALACLCALASAAVAIAGTRMSGYAVDAFIKAGDLAGLATLCLVLGGMYALGALATFAQNRIMIRVAQRSSGDMRRELFDKLQRLPLRYFDARPSGDLMSRLTNDVDNVSMMLAQGVTQLFSGIVSVVGMLVAMLILSPLLTVIGLALVPLMILGPRRVAIATQPSFVEQQKELGKLNAYIEESISGQRTLSLFGQEERARAEFAAINERYVRCSTRAQGLSGTMGPINNAVNNLCYLIISVCGALLVISGGGMTVGVVFSFLLYMRGFTRPINDVLNLFSTLQSALAGAERVFEVIDEEPEADEPGAEAAGELAGEVAIRCVHFEYEAGKPVLEDADISARAGQTVAIAGPTGAGKTTIMNLLPRFYDFGSGSIEIDGKDIRSLTRASLRSRIAMVLQEPFLFSASVRENIRYGRLSASDTEVEEASRKARAHDFIMQLPEGYDTVLSDNGGNLSLGQRQLLSIARAIVARSSILILDEATSSIDTRTELVIQSALLELMKGKTSFVIAHRLSTIRKADKIVVIDGGRVVESGTHDELIAARGIYAGLFESQYSTGMPL
jgi:ABC-type multidrug transport system, ATPase and permease components